MAKRIRQRIVTLVWVAAHAMIFTAALLLGYRAGIELLLARMRHYDQLKRAVVDGTLGVEQTDLFPWFAELLSGGLMVYRFRGYPVALGDEWVHVGMVVFCLAALSTLFARRAPLRLAPRQIHLAPQPARDELVRLWRRILRKSGRWFLVAAVGCFLGFAAFVIDDLYSLIRISALFKGPMSALVGLNPPPVWAFLGIPDSALFMLGAMVLPGGLIVIVARARMRRDREFEEQWCAWCGYPCAEAGPLDSPARPVCVECGRHPATSPLPRARIGTRGLICSACVLLASVAGVFTLAPRVAYSLFQITPQELDKIMATHDRIILVPGVVIRTERSTETIWIRAVVLPADETNTEGIHLSLLIHTRAQERDGLSPSESIVIVRHDPLVLVRTHSGVLSSPLGVDIKYNMLWQGTPTEMGYLVLYLSPRNATSIEAVAPGDHPPFDKP